MPLTGGNRAWGAALLIAAGALSSCRTRGDGAAGSPPAAGRLTSPAPVHDFGRVLDGDPLRYAFTVTNAGAAPVRIARVDRSPACAPGAAPVAPLRPSESTTLAIECTSRNRPRKLADTILVHPDDGGPPLRLELRATIDPLLAFETSLATLETTPGHPVTKVVRLVGPLAAEARPTVKEVGGAAGLRAHALRAGDPRGPGVQLVLASERTGEVADRLLIGTGLGRPPELSLPYVVRVKSGIEIDPAKPYFNLHDPASRSLVLAVRSVRPGFRIRRAEITNGPFRAALEGAGVRVSVDEDRLSPGERGFLGTLVLTTNDPTEPRKEIQLFAMGAVEPSPSAAPPTTP